MSEFLDKAKDLADKVKDKAEELVDKVGDKLPDSVTDKIEKIIPGDPRRRRQLTRAFQRRWPHSSACTVRASRPGAAGGRFPAGQPQPCARMSSPSASRGRPCHLSTPGVALSLASSPCIGRPSTSTIASRAA